MKTLNKIFDYKNKVVLITGCNGQVGQSLVKLFLSLDAKVYGIDLKENNVKKKNLNILRKIYVTKIK